MTVNSVPAPAVHAGSEATLSSPETTARNDFQVCYSRLQFGAYLSSVYVDIQAGAVTIALHHVLRSCVEQSRAPSLF